MTELTQIAARQQPDGGWGYGLESWTEPTALAILALRTGQPDHATALHNAAGWLRRSCRPDGGWAPNPQVDESVTWATSLAVLALTSLDSAPCTESVRWLVATSGRESGFAFRFSRWITGTKNPDRSGSEGWPWYPRSAAWIAPTGLAIRALQSTLLLQSPSLARAASERIALGREFLLARRCLDGGWNHGSSRALGIEAESYPETTGMALLGLLGVPRAKLAPSFRYAAQELPKCLSMQGQTWLQLALLAHGEPLYPEPFVQPRDICGAALQAMAIAARNGSPVFSA